MTGRGAYDDLIRADQLWQGDELHLTVMGGDEYVDVTVAELTPDGKKVKLSFLSWGGYQHDELDPDYMVWIKKREQAE